MPNAFRLIVYLSCPQCLTLYAVSQEEQPKRCSGAFICGRCAAAVHKWTGLYDFRDWTQVTVTPEKSGSKPRRISQPGCDQCLTSPSDTCAGTLLTFRD